MSDHGSLTTSFQVVPAVPPGGASDSATQGAKNDCDASIGVEATGGDATGTAAAAASVGSTGAASGTVEKPDGRSSEARDWGGGDDGHYGLR